MKKKKSTKAESEAGDSNDEDDDSFYMDDLKKTNSRRIFGSGTVVEGATTAGFSDYHTADSTGDSQVTCLVKTN